MIKINPWLGSELAFVADSGLWDGHRFALAAGNRYKGESRNAAILHSTKNAPAHRSWGRMFRRWACSSHFYWGFGVPQSHFYYIWLEIAAKPNSENTTIDYALQSRKAAADGGVLYFGSVLQWGPMS